MLTLLLLLLIIIDVDINTQRKSPNEMGANINIPLTKKSLLNKQMTDRNAAELEMKSSCQQRWLF